MDEPQFLTVEHVLEIHAYQVSQFGGDPGILDIGLLESAVAQPKQSFGGSFLHPDLPSMAAAYLFHIASNHAFQDGNKRTGTHAAMIFLELDGIELEYPVDETEAITLGVASHSITKEQVIEFFRKLMAANEP